MFKSLMWKGSAQSDVSFGTGPRGGGWKVRISLKVSPEQKEGMDERDSKTEEERE